MEIWKHAVGRALEYPYEVSDLGNVRRILKDGYRQMSPTPNTQGRLSVSLSKAKHKQLSVPVHILVKEAFDGEPSNGEEIDHLNNVFTDNRLENLKYVSQNDNLRKMPKRQDCKHCFIGIAERSGRWTACATFEKKYYHLGTFDSAVEAARARDKFWRDKKIEVVFNFPF